MVAAGLSGRFSRQEYDETGGRNIRPRGRVTFRPAVPSYRSKAHKQVEPNGM
ncbi:hypothetical protein SRO_0458 [Streptomyces rochei]|nr:hypothetical protein SRO_0458 [Streptomyces rochei]